MTVETQVSGGQTITQEFRLDAEVTGYGTLMLPNGNSSECLRIEYMSTVVLFGQEQTSRRIQFVNAEGHDQAVITFEDDNQAVQNIAYTLVSGGSPILDVPKQQQPRKFQLSENYPNPFNPSTTIQFNLLQAGEVQLSVYNILGRKVETLVDGVHRAGRHTVTFNAGNLSSGVYIYRLKTNGYSQSRRMLLMK